MTSFFCTRCEVYAQHPRIEDALCWICRRQMDYGLPQFHTPCYSGDLAGVFG